MDRSRKKKYYDMNIAPGKRPLYRMRKVLFVLSVVAFILNMILIAAFDDTMREKALRFVLISVLFAVLVLIDNRKANWTWPYIIVLAGMFLLFSALCVFTAQLIFLRYIWVGELIFFCVFIWLSLRKKNKR